MREKLHAYKVTVEGVDWLVFTDSPRGASWAGIDVWRDECRSRRHEFPKTCEVSRAPEHDNFPHANKWRGRPIAPEMMKIWSLQTA